MEKDNYNEFKNSVTLIRGAKGVYRWEIKCRDNDPKEAVRRSIEIDNDYKAKYGDVSE